jgi:hypothetical protein
MKGSTATAIAAFAARQVIRPAHLHIGGAMSSIDSPADAYMDPWCVVRIITGDRLLFGFAVHHSGTGGLSWVRGTARRSVTSMK